jgi:hypothetical protein
LLGMTEERLLADDKGKIKEPPRREPPRREPPKKEPDRRDPPSKEPLVREPGESPEKPPENLASLLQR